MEVKEKLAALLADYFQIGDSYHYTLGRSKEAFGAGTMSLDDFTEYGDDDVADLAEYLHENGVAVRQGIPVSERVPRYADTNGREKVLAYDVYKECWEDVGFSIVAAHPGWYSHWMPMPEPPEEEVRG